MTKQLFSTLITTTLASAVLFSAAPVLVSAQQAETRPSLRGTRDDRQADRAAKIEEAKLAAQTTESAVASWVVDPVHSSIVFNIGHNGISRVYGSFENFSGTIQFNPENLAQSSIEISVKTSSVDTNNDGRDQHIQDGEYLKVEANEFATFKSTSITAVDENTFKATGDLSIAGTTTSITFDFDVSEVITDRRGSTRVGANTTFKIDRNTYSVGKPEGLSPDVELQISLQAIKQ
ncbi:MAG: YceI family protein [Sumerlaeia bacterium]